METSAALARAADQVVGEAVAALERRDQSRCNSEERHRSLRQLFELVLRCVDEGRAEPIIRLSEQMAAGRFAVGTDIGDVQATFNALEEALWRHVAAALPGDQRIEVLRLVSAIIGAGKDTLARTYVALTNREGDQPGGGQRAPEGTGGASASADALAAAPIRLDVRGRIGIVTLDDQRKRNAIGARMANGVIAALDSLHAQNVRAVVLRATPGYGVWSAGHDIDELPRGRRDPLGYNDPLEGLLRAIRSFPAPVIAMVHGTVWGGALDLVLSCDLVTADETATFAITSVNLGLPYNITGLLHFVGRLPVNLIKEMFFTAAPLDARKARECLLVNHLVASAELEQFTLELAETMAAKSPMAIAVIKEQLRVLTDYQPIAAQTYERVQGLRRQAYDSSDYLEGLNAFAEKRQPVFRGT